MSTLDCPQLLGYQWHTGSKLLLAAASTTSPSTVSCSFSSSSSSSSLSFSSPSSFFISYNTTSLFIHECPSLSGRKTVRRKASSRRGKDSPSKQRKPTIIKEEEDDEYVLHQPPKSSEHRFRSSNSEPGHSVSPPEFRNGKLSKPSIQPRKTSEPSVMRPPVSPKPVMQDLLRETDHQPNMPPRPRPTQIKKVMSKPENNNHQQPAQEKERSTSPMPKPRKQVRQNGHTDNSPTEEARSDPVAEATQQLVEATLKYVLVTRDPTLIAALKEAIAASPDIQQLLKE